MQILQLNPTWKCLILVQGTHRNGGKKNHHVMVGDSAGSKFTMRNRPHVCAISRRLPGHLVLLLQQQQDVVGVEEQSPRGQTIEEQDQQAPLQDDANALHVLTAKCLMKQEMQVNEIRRKDNNINNNNNQTISSSYLGNEGITSHNESKANRGCGEIYSLGRDQSH